MFCMMMVVRGGGGNWGGGGGGGSGEGDKIVSEGRERQRDRQTQTQTHTERQRQREGERERERERERLQRKADTERIWGAARRALLPGCALALTAVVIGSISPLDSSWISALTCRETPAPRKRGRRRENGVAFRGSRCLRWLWWRMEGEGGLCTSGTQISSLLVRLWTLGGKRGRGRRVR